MWDANYPGGSYDAVRRRQGSAGSNGGGVSPQKPAIAKRPAAGMAAPARSAAPTSVAAPQAAKTDVAALTKTISELKRSVDEMEKERDFYFGKLRDIEIATQKVTDPAITSSPFLQEVTRILYATEDGFEIPTGETLMAGSGN